jgi:DNA-binding CsgD family transcriptional regulator
MKQQRIYDLWDSLAEFGPARSEEALLHLLTGLCGLLDAQQAFWLGAVRLKMPGDPMGGWRPAGIRYLHAQPRRDAAYIEHCRRIKRGDIDPSILAIMRGAGTFRVKVRSENVTPEWFDSEYYHSLIKPFDARDVVYMVMPVNADMESWLGIERVGPDRPMFSEADRELLTLTGRALKWFHRHVALQRGLLIADKPLTDTERRVLGALLGGGSESKIAAQLGLTQATVHTYATRIFRKFNVKGRNGLNALWLGH